MTGARTTGMALAVALASLMLTGCEPETADAPPPLRPVLFAVIKPRTIDTFGPFAGSIAPRYQSDLGFRIAGRIVARDVSVGDVVRSRQRLAALDPTVTEFALAQARADLANAQAQLVNAEATAARQRALLATGAVSQAQLESATAARDTAAARVTQGQASLQKAQDQNGYTELSADYAGVVTAWSAEVGQVVSDGQTVVTLARLDIKEAVVDIPDAQLDEVRPGQAFDVRLQSAPDIVTTGRVREIAPQSDSATRTRRIRFSLAEPPPAFRLGTTIAVSRAQPIPPQVEVPPTALLDREGATFVWIVAPDGKSVETRKVEVGARTAGQVTVASGLAKGDKVVIAGVHSLTEHQPIRPEPPL